uniref:Peptidylprolyl isomerase n=1 Tax=Steinernema glaseri TaxID=37863 RepID=A0A1I7YEJ0_9BILA
MSANCHCSAQRPRVYKSPKVLRIGRFELVARPVPLPFKMRAALVNPALALLFVACVLNAAFVAAEDDKTTLEEKEQKLLALMDDVVSAEKFNLNFPIRTIVHLLNTEKLKKIMQDRFAAISEAMFLKQLTELNLMKKPKDHTTEPQSQ